jgi:hypothetical protein
VDFRILSRSWFNDVEIREPEPVQLFCDIIKESRRVAVRHRVPRSARSNSHSDAIAAPHRYHCFHYFQQKTRPVLDRTTIGVGALVAAILQEFIGQIAVGRMKFDPVYGGAATALRLRLKLPSTTPTML